MFTMRAKIIRRHEVHCPCPMAGIFLMLVFGIMIVHLYPYGLTFAGWITLLIFFVGMSIIIRSYQVKSLLLFLAFVPLGGGLEMLQQTEQASEGETVAYEDLSMVDRARLHALDLRQQALSCYKERSIQNQDYAILSAMTLGDKSMLSEDTRQTFSSSGASHVLAISGLHIGIIFQLLMLLLGGGKKNRLLCIPLVLVAVWVYIFVIGLPASGIRSACMITVFCINLLSWRRTPAVNSLFVTGVIMLLADTSYLYDVGFQLSFTAVLAILLLYKPIFSWLPKEWESLRPVKWIWSMTAVSLAAQIGTMPLVAYYFGTVSCFSLLSSFIAIPITTLIIYVSAIFFVCAGCSILAPLQDALALLLDMLTMVMQGALRFVCQLPGACISGVEMNIPQLVLVYAIIVTGCLIIRKLRLFHSHRTRLAVFENTDYNRQEYQTSL